MESLRPSSGRRGPRRATLTSINVTPLVDVMLVLLVVFMITAPLLTTGVPVDLPEADSAAVKETEEPMVLTVDREGRLYLQETEIGADVLAQRLRAVLARNPDLQVFVRGDEGVAYGAVLRLMNEAYAAGVRKVALLTRPLARS